uniref:Uncharacterized protein n=1 Tax=Oryza sativa subsp. japonica TaxID=39947 RepID=Q67VU3_ORYSJ|nr:hypothetical protein [Oryza sativa Japonica Group]BAD37726.1 hypothetical protein [Oryza sativa Japonica Group]
MQKSFFVSTPPQPKSGTGSGLRPRQILWLAASPLHAKTAVLPGFGASPPPSRRVARFPVTCSGGGEAGERREGRRRPRARVRLCRRRGGGEEGRVTMAGGQGSPPVARVRTTGLIQLFKTSVCKNHFFLDGPFKISASKDKGIFTYGTLNSPTCKNTPKDSHSIFLFSTPLSPITPTPLLPSRLSLSLSPFTPLPHSSPHLLSSLLPLDSRLRRRRWASAAASSSSPTLHLSFSSLLRAVEESGIGG